MAYLDGHDFNFIVGEKPSCQINVELFGELNFHLFDEILARV